MAGIQAGEGKLYLCAIKDACSRRIIGYSIDHRMKASLAVQALSNAIANRRRTGAEVSGCIVHSDRGSQFRSRKFLRTLEHHSLVGSMGRVGAAGDCQSILTGSCKDQVVLTGAL